MMVGKTGDRVSGRALWLILGLAVILMILEVAFASAVP